MSHNTKHEVSMLDLPFIHYDKVTGAVNEWNVPKAKGYFNACTTGVLYAREYLKYLRDSYDDGGYNTLVGIVGYMDRHTDADEKGYQVGFLNTLEELLVQLATTTDFEKQLNEMIAQSVACEMEVTNE